MTNIPRIAVLIVAAGVGQRVGGPMPKQYQILAGKPMLRHSVERFLANPRIAQVQVVIHPEHADHYAAAVEGLTLPPPVFGGAERQDSVRLGLAAMAEDPPRVVLVHDAARPFVSDAVIERLLSVITPDRAAVPALAVADTVRRYDQGHWEEVSRTNLLRIQTPQAFPYRMLARLHDDAMASALATDDAALWVAAGLALEYVQGEEQLNKMTTAEDIACAHALLPRRMATGMGFDVHQLMPAGGKHTMRIGGIDIAHDHKLHGHSDADVVLHAVTDALLGALGEGDIGTHFPPGDPQWKGADSRRFVEEAVRLVKARGGIIQHVDTTVICEAPKIGPHREAMRAAMAALLGVPLSYVSVKATTTEKLGFTGRGEGVAAQAVATLSLPAEEV